MATTTVQDLIGNTPLVALRHLDTGCCALFLKLEYQNPGGSIKDRIARYMIDAAEASGDLRPGGTIIEATAGNTGIALAQIALLRGYKMALVVPDKMSTEKIAHLKAMGVHVVLTRSDVRKGHPEYYQDLAERMAHDMEHAVYINQFANDNNPKAHEKTTAPELWAQMHEHIDAVVLGVGTGGHLTGISRYLSRVSPDTEIVLADPEGSILAHYIETGALLEKTGSWKVEGIGEDFIPSTCDVSRVTQAITVSDQESFSTARALLHKEGIFAGSSSGTVVHAALEYCRAQSTPKRVVTFAYDSGNKYLSKMYNDQWMETNGYHHTV